MARRIALSHKCRRMYGRMADWHIFKTSKCFDKSISRLALLTVNLYKLYLFWGALLDYIVESFNKRFLTPIRKFPFASCLLGFLISVSAYTASALLVPDGEW